MEQKQEELEKGIPVARSTFLSAIAFRKVKARLGEMQFLSIVKNIYDQKQEKWIPIKIAMERTCWNNCYTERFAHRVLPNDRSSAKVEKCW